MGASAPLLLACITVALLWWGERRERLRLQAALVEAGVARESLQRVARLAGLDLRHAAMRLGGYAASLGAFDCGLASLAERCRVLADDLGTAGLPLTAASLREECFDLLGLARDSVEAVASAVSPGRRQFRLPPETYRVASGCVWADRRAIRQVLGRVLSEAVFNTGPDDSISIFLDEDDGDLVLAIADEGAGLIPDTEPGEAAIRSDSRGVGFALALSRALMEAHGGRLETVASLGAGTRVSLVFPRDRRRN